MYRSIRSGDRVVVLTVQGPLFLATVRACLVNGGFSVVDDSGGLWDCRGSEVRHEDEVRQLFAREGGV